jgi:hypothetical protein
MPKGQRNADVLQYNAQNLVNQRTVCKDYREGVGKAEICLVITCCSYKKETENKRKLETILEDIQV